MYPEKFVSLVHSLLTDMKAYIHFSENLSEPILIENIVKEGEVLLHHLYLLSILLLPLNFFSE